MDRITLLQNDPRHMCTPVKRLANVGALSLLLTGLLVVSDDAWGIDLVVEGKSDYVIVLADEAAVPVKTAAQELRDHLTKVAGVDLPVVVERTREDHPKMILVGHSKTLQHLVPSIDWPKLGKDGIVIKTVADDLVLAGGEPRGTVNAVFTFLEDHVGVRWWTPMESYLPRKPTLSVGPIDLTYTPPFDYREPFYRPVASAGEKSNFETPELYERSKTLNPLFAARLRLNGMFNNNPARYGGHWQLSMFCHSFYPFLRPEKYFKEHPDWYSLIDGERVTKKAQLCLTNRAMRRQFIANVIDWLRHNDPGTPFISISPNDGLGPCQCEHCQAIARREGSESGPIIDFVNEVAKAIEEEFPNVLVETLAYSYFAEPPRHIKPRHNVLIRLCAETANYAFPLVSPENRVFAKRLKDWSAISPKLWVWSYAGLNNGWSVAPFPTLANTAVNYRDFAANNVSGIFEQGNRDSDVSDFLYLRTWLTAHLMWDPTSDQEALTQEFLNGYYGPAGPFLYQYLKLLERAATKGRAFLRFQFHDVSFVNYDLWRRGKELYDQAEDAVADDPTLTNRVQRNRLVFDYTYFRRYPWMKVHAKRKGLKFLGAPKQVSAFEAVVARLQEVSEGMAVRTKRFHTETLRIKERLKQDVAVVPPPQRFRHLAADDWFDIQEDEIRLQRYGFLTRIVEDPQASNGKACSLVGGGMSVQEKRILVGGWHVEHYFSVEGLQSVGPKLRCYAIVKCAIKGERKEREGTAFTLGIDNFMGGGWKNARFVKLQEIKDEEYHAYDLGISMLQPGLQFYMDASDSMEAVYLDRIILVRDGPERLHERRVPWNRSHKSGI